MKRLLAIVLSLISCAVYSAVDTGRFVQLVDYIAVDYQGAVSGGEVVDPAEYGEMQEFGATVVAQAHQLHAEVPTADLVTLASRLQALIERRAEAEQVATAAAELRRAALQHLNVDTVPRKLPDLRRARTLYHENCASCHGIDGQGDGVLARTLDPTPTNFYDRQRYGERTLYGLYSTISLGVEGTGMMGFGESLSENERWALAFYVGRLGAAATLRQRGAEALAAGAAAPLAELGSLTTLTPAEAARRFGEDGEAVMAYLRSDPSPLFDRESPLAFAREHTASSLQLYLRGDREKAYRDALSAYLDGFELAEHTVDTAEPALRREIETAMTRYRELIRAGAEQQVVSAQATQVLVLLEQADTALSSHSLTPAAAFAGSFIILIREGLEALLVVAALAAFLIKTGRRDGLVYLHLGWSAALGLGILTWLGSRTLFDFSGAGRELTEGVAALAAMAVLFYVGFWLHNKTHALQWKRFIEGSVNKALSSGTLWALAGLSFIAVYREVFETILFYQAMWLQADTSGQGSMLAGLGAAAGVLVLLAWLLLRYSTRLPLRQFFAFTSMFMFALAVIFAGKGVAALQEAGRLPLNPVAFPRIDILGIYPNLEGLALQALLLVLAVVIMLGFGQRTATAAR